MTQPNTLYQAGANQGYLLTFSSAVVNLVLACNLGEFWVKPNTVAATAPVASPASPGIVTGWIHMKAGAKFSLSQNPPQSGMEAFQNLQIWSVNAGGELVVTGQ